MTHKAKYTELIALIDLPRLLPRRRGKPVHLATVYRWVRRGVRGRKLAVVMIGGVIHVSPQALDEFLSGGPGHQAKQPQTQIIDALLRNKRLK